MKHALLYTGCILVAVGYLAAMALLYEPEKGESYFLSPDRVPTPVYYVAGAITLTGVIILLVTQFLY